VGTADGIAREPRRIAFGSFLLLLDGTVREPSEVRSGFPKPLEDLLLTCLAPNPEDRFQLALYALYAESEWGVDPTTVHTADVYLTSGEIEEQTFTRQELDEVHATVGASLAQMREVHFDADREAGDVHAFPMLGESPGEARVCGRCNYRALCGRELT